MSYQQDVIIEADMAARLRDALASYDDEELTLDMIEGETRLFELIDSIMAKRANDEAMAEALSSHVAALNERKARFKHRADIRKALVLKAMEHADLKKLERPAYTASIKRNPAKVIVSDEAALPDDMLRVKKSPNLTAIKKALESGVTIAGATLSNGGQSLTVRVK